MPLIRKMFDEQIRFRVTPLQKRRLFDEARRQDKAAADLLREFMDTLPDPDPLPEKKRKGRVSAGAAA